MSRSPAEPIQPARVPACSSKPGPPLITMALMRLREFLCLHSLASLSIIKKRKVKKKITSVSGKEWLRREKVSTSKCIDIENRGKLFCLHGLCLEKTSRQIPEALCLPVDVCMSEAPGSSYRGSNLSVQANNQSYIILINTHHSNCLHLPHNKVTL